MKETDHPRISVSLDDKEIFIKLDSPNDEKQVKKFTWEKILKIWNKSYDYGAPNFLYISV